jgi:membrane associated rhomboid family serine protease
MVEPAEGSTTEVFHAAQRAECAERALVLTAVGIDSELGFAGGAPAPSFVLRVATADAARALEQLAQYEKERPAAALPPASAPATEPHRYAWVGCALYALILIGIAIIVAKGLWRLDAFALGELNAGAVQAGQWWRAWTALTLHLDAPHLIANLGAGIWFGYVAARQLGPGHAWLLGVSGAAVANLLEALLGPASHRAVGASTAVFAVLGAVSAYAWRTRVRQTPRWAVQWAPLVGGLVLLGWTGSGGDEGAEQVDVVAHAGGFLCGALLGALAAQPQIEQRLRRVPQWLTGLLAVAQIAIAWLVALAS